MQQHILLHNNDSHESYNARVLSSIKIMHIQQQFPSLSFNKYTDAIVLFCSFSFWPTFHCKYFVDLNMLNKHIKFSQTLLYSKAKTLAALAAVL